METWRGLKSLFQDGVVSLQAAGLVGITLSNSSTATKRLPFGSGEQLCSGSCGTSEISFPHLIGSKATGQFLTFVSRQLCSARLVFFSVLWTLELPGQALGVGGGGQSPFQESLKVPTCVPRPPSAAQAQIQPPLNQHAITISVRCKAIPRGLSK